MADKFREPNVSAPIRDSSFEYSQAEIRRNLPPDVSAATIEESALNNPLRQILVNVIRLQRKNSQVKRKNKGTIAMHVADLELNLEPMPGNIRQIMDELFASQELTPERLNCAIELMRDDRNIQNFTDQMNAANPDDAPMDWLMTMLEKMTSKKHTFGIELLLRLIRFCLAYAVHMIIGGLCAWFTGKLNIPIPFVGSLPLGTLIATEILAPTEKMAKQALGFPCNPQLPTPKFCFGFFEKDNDAANLLPCCMPAGMSGAQLKMAELLEKLKGGGSTGTAISDFLKVWKAEGGLKSGYIKVGGVTERVNTDISGSVNSNQPQGAGFKNALSALQQSVDQQSPAGQKASLSDLTQKAVKKVDIFHSSKKAGSSNLVEQIELDIFSCWAQAVVSDFHDEPDNPYQGPPCLVPSDPTNNSAIHRDMAEQLVNFVATANAVPSTPRPTQAGNLMNLISVLKKTENMDDNLGEIKSFLKSDADIVNPGTKRCIEGNASLKYGGPDKLTGINSVNDPKEFFSKLNTDNKINASDVPDSTLTIGGGDILENLTGASGDVFGDIGQKTGEFLQQVVGVLEGAVDEVDRYVSGVNQLTKFFSSKEFCCIVYLIVLLADVARGKALCPTDDISHFFKYANKFQDRKDIASLKIQLAFLKSIMDAARLALATGIEIQGIKLPLKDLMERVRTTITTITKLLIDFATEPIEKTLDQVLLNPDVTAIVQNNCFGAWDFLSMFKCGIEWFKLKLSQIALDLFQNNFQNIDLIKNIRIGGMRLKVLDMLSQMLGLLLDLLLGIGDCYDPDDYTKAIISRTLEEQYSGAERVFALMQKANVTPQELDKWSKTVEGEDPLNIDYSAPENQDVHSDFTGSILTPATVRLLRSTVPIALFSDSTPARRLVGYEEFVGRLEEHTGTTVSQVYVDIFALDDGIFKMFGGKAA